MATFTYDKLIQITSSGIEVADYAEIVSALMEQYRNIYGSDIDLDPRSGDGRFVYSVANIINTSFLVIKQLYANLDPSTATGKYLDTLCSLTNVTRLPASSSVAYVKLTNNESTEVEMPTLMDDAGDLWSQCDINGDSTSDSLIVGTSYHYFKSERVGPVSTSKLFNVVVNGNIEIEMESLSIGSERESDADLRNRRSSTTMQGITTAERLEALLKQEYCIKKAKVISNNGYTTVNGTSQSDDSLLYYANGNQITLPKGCVAIIVDYDDVFAGDNNQKTVDKIGEIIRSNLTPGVLTSTNNSSLVQTYTYADSSALLIQSIKFYRSLQQLPTITITLTQLPNYAGDSTDKVIAKEICDYCDSCDIGEIPNSSQLIQAAQNVDPLYQSRTTYIITSVQFTNVKQGCSFHYNFDYNTTDEIDALGYSITTSQNNGLTIRVITIQEH